MNTDSPRIHWTIALVPFVVLVVLQVLVIRQFGSDAIDGASQTALLFAAAVAATPAMIALMEKTCLMSVCDKIGEGNTTVGISVNIKHLKASPVGSTIRCEAELVEVDRRRLVFAVKCFEGENLIGEGIHERFVVESAKFMAKLQ